MSIDRIEVLAIEIRQDVRAIKKLLEAFVVPQLPKCAQCGRPNKGVDEDYCDACLQWSDSPRKKGRKKP